MMDALITKYQAKPSDNAEGTHILLVGSGQTGKLRRTLETENNSFIITEAATDAELASFAEDSHTDAVIMVTDTVTPAETFNITLKKLTKMGLNTRTIIISDNPFKYLGFALKAKAAALLYRKIDAHDLVLIIHEIRTWSHGQPIPSGISSMDNQPGPETKSGGE